MNKQSGSAILWVLVWLTGMAALGYFCLMRHVPALELATENRINQALSGASAEGVTGTVNGYTATLSGTVESQSQKQSFVALAAGTLGVRTVVDELKLTDGNVVKADDNTPIIGKPIKLDAQTSVATTAASTATEAEEPEVPANTQKTTGVVAETIVDAGDNKTEQSVAATQDPSIKLAVEDGTLMLDGQVAQTDNLNPLVDQAKASLNIDFVSNSAEAREDTKPATWIDPITALLPAMAPLSNPGISIQKNQITLKGTAPDRKTHDALINRALQLLGDYALVERVNFAETDPSTIQKLDEAKSEAILKANKDTVKTVVETVAGAQATPTTTTVTSAVTSAEIAPDQKPVAKIAAGSADGSAVSNDSSSDISKDNPPTDPGAKVRAAFDRLPSKRILFKSGSAILATESQAVLNNIAQLLRDHPDAEMDIDGHTDATGNDEINLLLSQSRANAVRDYLIDQGISVYRLTAYGFGEGKPIANNDSPEGRALNRRIEFKF